MAIGFLDSATCFKEIYCRPLSFDKMLTHLCSKVENKKKVFSLFSQPPNDKGTRESQSTGITNAANLTSDRRGNTSTAVGSKSNIPTSTEENQSSSCWNQKNRRTNVGPRDLVPDGLIFNSEDQSLNPRTPDGKILSSCGHRKDRSPMVKPKRPLYTLSNESNDTTATETSEQRSLPESNPAGKLRKSGRMTAGTAIHPEVCGMDPFQGMETESLPIDNTKTESQTFQRIKDDATLEPQRSGKTNGDAWIRHNKEHVGMAVGGTKSNIPIHVEDKENKGSSGLDNRPANDKPTVFILEGLFSKAEDQSSNTSVIQRTPSERMPGSFADKNMFDKLSNLHAMVASKPDIEFVMGLPKAKTLDIIQTHARFAAEPGLFLLRKDQEKYEAWRLGTFSYVGDLAQFAIRLAQTGFYYDIELDDIICFSCRLSKRHWERSENPAHVHLDLSPHCKQATFHDPRNVSFPEAPYPYVETAAESDRLGNHSEGINHGEESSAATATTHQAPPASSGGSPSTTVPDGNSGSGTMASGAGGSLYTTGDSVSTATAAEQGRPSSTTHNDDSLATDCEGRLSSTNTSTNTNTNNSSRNNSSNTNNNKNSSSNSSSNITTNNSSSNSSSTTTTNTNTTTSTTTNTTPNTTTTITAPTPTTNTNTTTNNSSSSNTTTTTNSNATNNSSSTTSTNTTTTTGSSAVDVRQAASPFNSSVSVRLQSFTNWPASRLPCARRLVLAGFYSLGTEDSVRCFYCGITLQNWKPVDDPWVVHVQFRFSCGYVKAIMGEQFVRRTLVQLATRPREDISSNDSQLFSLQSDSVRSQDRRGEPSSRAAASPLPSPAATATPNGATGDPPGSGNTPASLPPAPGSSTHALVSADSPQSVTSAQTPERQTAERSPGASLPTAAAADLGNAKESQPGSFAPKSFSGLSKDGLGAGSNGLVSASFHNGAPTGATGQGGVVTTMAWQAHRPVLSTGHGATHLGKAGPNGSANGAPDQYKAHISRDETTGRKGGAFNLDTANGERNSPNSTGLPSSTQSPAKPEAATQSRASNADRNSLSSSGAATSENEANNTDRNSVLNSEASPQSTANNNSSNNVDRRNSQSSAEAGSRSRARDSRPQPDSTLQADAEPATVSPQNAGTAQSTTAALLPPRRTTSRIMEPRRQADRITPIPARSSTTRSEGPAVSGRQVMNVGPGEEEAYMRRLQEDNQRLRQRQLCRVCREQIVDTIFLPCGHLCTCSTCAPTISRCCLCNFRIRATAHVYLD